MARENREKHRNTAETIKEGQKTVLGRLFKLVFVLVVLGGIGLTGYAYLADLSPQQEQITVPVTLNAD
ncbi:hypothetical protein [Pseudotabrizicola sp. L79]|uniref:hypothetical protein n=1 Tax=Pseudotabrizicola sp. L79 TaxID=3118402 RepID=UPI002F93AA66